MSDTECVCRLCLKIVASNTCSALNATFTEKLQMLVPNLKLTPSVNPVVCKICTESLEESHKLKRTCSSSNKLIRFLKNYLGIKHCVELKELIKGNNKKDEKWPRNEHVCRICLKSNEGGYKSMKDAKSDEFGSILESCLSALDENLTSNPLICKICIDTMHKVCNFIKHLTDIENKINCYCEKLPSEKVDLLQVLKFDMDKEPPSSQIIDEVQPTSNEKLENRKRPSSEENADSAKRQKMDSELNNEEDKVFKLPCTEENVDSCTSDAAVNELPYFDFSIGTVFAPYKRKISIKDWILQVEEIKSRLKWSDATAKHEVLGMMKKLPQLRSWFSSVADVISWEEFKEKIMHTFAKEDDYYFNIVKMVKRTKRQTETYVEYYHEKLNLLEPLNFSEEQVISCFLGGISDSFTNCIARMGNYSSRDELLTFFKSCDDKKDTKMANKFDDQQIKSEIENENNFSTDYSFNEPKKSLIVLLEKKNLGAITDTCQKQSEEHFKESDQICSCCDQKGHSNVNCPLLMTNKTLPSIKTQKTEKMAASHGNQNNNIIVVHENLLISDGNSENASIQISPTTDKQSPETVEKKCACCDKIGHSSTDCPLTRGKVEVLNTLRQQKPATNSERGRQSDNIIIVHEDISETVSSFPSTGSKNQQDESKKCSFCDKIGHSSLVCPLIDCEGTTRRNNIKIVMDKDRLNKAKLPDSSSTSTALAKDDLVCEVVEKKVESTSKERQNINQKKCSCCNKVGHTNVECPLTDRNKQSKETQSPNNQQRCSKCNKLGHLPINCLLIRVKDDADRKSDKSKPNQKETSAQVTQKCSSCNNVGHLSINCPYVDVKKISANLTNESKSSEKSKRKCLCCNQFGHSTLDCPRLGISKQDKTSKYEPKNVSKPSQARNTVQSEEKCTCCNKSGHATVNCPFYSFFNRNRPAATQSTPNPVKESKEMLRKTIGQTKDNTQSQKKADNDSTDQKCCFCNKVGHSSIECFRIRFEQKHAQPNDPAPVSLQAPQTVTSKQIPETSTQVSLRQKGSQGVLKCDFCGRMGHRLSECFFARFDRKIYEAHHTTTSSSSRQCLYCGKFGHLQPDCPKNKPPSKRNTGFKKFGPGSSTRQ